MPEEYETEKNAALVIDHGFDAEGKPFFEFVKGRGNTMRIQVPDETNIKCIYDFPSLNYASGEKYAKGEDQWFLPDARFGIPSGRGPASCNVEDARQLFRNESGIHLIARSRGEQARDVMCGFPPSSDLGAIAWEVKSRGL